MFSLARRAHRNIFRESRVIRGLRVADFTDEAEPRRLARTLLVVGGASPLHKITLTKDNTFEHLPCGGLHVAGHRARGNRPVA